MTSTDSTFRLFLLVACFDPSQHESGVFTCDSTYGSPLPCNRARLHQLSFFGLFHIRSSLRLLFGLSNFSLDFAGRHRLRRWILPIPTFPTCNLLTHFARCLQSFARRFDLERHSYQHTGQKPYECPTCHRQFIRQDYLKRHECGATGGGGSKKRESSASAQQAPAVAGLPGFDPSVSAAAMEGLQQIDLATLDIPTFIGSLNLPPPDLSRVPDIDPSEDPAGRSTEELEARIAELKSLLRGTKGQRDQIASLLAQSRNEAMGWMQAAAYFQGQLFAIAAHYGNGTPAAAAPSEEGSGPTTPALPPRPRPTKRARLSEPSADQVERAIRTARRSLPAPQPIIEEDDEPKRPRTAGPRRPGRKPKSNAPPWVGRPPNSFPSIIPTIEWKGWFFRFVFDDFH